MKFYRDFTPVPHGAAYDPSIPRVVPTTWEEWLNLVMPGDVEMTEEEMKKIEKDLGFDKGPEAIDQAIDEIFRGLQDRMAHLSFLKPDASDGEESERRNVNTPTSVSSGHGTIISDGPAEGTSAMNTSPVASTSAAVAEGAVTATGAVELVLDARKMVIEVIRSPEKEKVEENGEKKDENEGTKIEKERENGMMKDVDVIEETEEMESEQENVVGASSRSDNNDDGEEDEIIDIDMLTADAGSLDPPGENQVISSSSSVSDDVAPFEIGDVWDYDVEGNDELSETEGTVVLDD